MPCPTLGTCIHSTSICLLHAGHRAGTWGTWEYETKIPALMELMCPWDSQIINSKHNVSINYIDCWGQEWRQGSELNKIAKKDPEKVRLEKRLVPSFHLHSILRKQRLRETNHVPKVTQHEVQAGLCCFLSPHRHYWAALCINSGTRTLSPPLDQ